MNKDNIEFTDIAIIGIATRFPNANNPDEFWENLIKEKESVYSFPEEEMKKAGWQKNYIKRKNMLIEEPF